MVRKPMNVHKNKLFSYGGLPQWNEKKINNQFLNNLIFFMFICFPAILLVETIDSYLHEFCARGILHSDFQ